MQLTKNRQSEDTIRKMIHRAFGDREISNVEELSEGMLNIAYRVSFADGAGSIIKIAAPNGQGLMSNEIALMDAEVKAMRIMRQYDIVNVAEIQYYDKTLELCSGTYFIMERISGENFFFAKNRMTDSETAAVSREIGRIQRRMQEITSGRFGLLGDTRRFESLYEFFFMLMNNLMCDMEKRDITVGAEKEEILDLLCRDRHIFDQVTKASLVHWDMWEGNIFVEDGHVSGVIDWERAMWGEPYMDDRFRRHTRNQDFLEGFGKTEFTSEEQRRIYWYDLFLYGMMIAEVTYRQYDDDSQSRRIRPLFAETWADLSHV